MSGQQNEQVKKVLAGFEPVWQRVTKGEPEPPPFPPPHGRPPGPVPPPPQRGPEETLTELLRAEERAAVCGRQLAARFSGPARAMLLRHAAAARARARALTAERFLMTGDRRAAREPCPRTRDRAAALRTACAQDRALEHDYRAAAARCPDSALRKLYENAAKELAAEYDQKRALLRRIV